MVLYSANLAGVVLIGQWMRWDARRAGLTTIDAETEREDLVSSVFIAGVFLLSIVVALFDASIAPYIWLAPLLRGARARGRTAQPHRDLGAMKATSPPGRAQLTETPVSGRTA